ncbi:MAG: hypothetical protein IJI14_10855, partial [Anaerolineaceae bacterium]|nr:hypothetical protein [Anaerolineaceae bacterium]
MSPKAQGAIPRAAQSEQGIDLLCVVVGREDYGSTKQQSLTNADLHVDGASDSNRDQTPCG